MLLEPGTIGGILLIVGAYALYKGKFMYSVLLYFLADMAWVVLAWQAGDIFGTVAISIGMLLGILVFIKTHTGVFVKDLHKGEN
ncbi:MAG: hypothetical protein U9R12_05735 [Candidatus Caldatribacteriota bacterium]|nr:hypothetical protein [Candidatus Caldatribacteriota bacterium]